MIYRISQAHGAPATAAAAPATAAPAASEEAPQPAQPPPAPVQILLRTLGGEETEMSVALAASVGDLRRMISSVRGTSYLRTQLALGPQALNVDLISLRDAGVTDGSTLDVVITNPPPEEFDSVYGQADGSLLRFEGHLCFHRGFSLLTDEEKATVLHAVVADDRVRKLTMQGIGLNDGDAALLAAALETSRALHVLNFSDNDIRETGANRLAEAFERNPAVREMYLFNNQISVVGRRRLEEAKTAAREQDGRLPIILCY